MQYGRPLARENCRARAAPDASVSLQLKFVRVSLRSGELICKLPGTVSLNAKNESPELFKTASLIHRGNLYVLLLSGGVPVLRCAVLWWVALCFVGLRCDVFRFLLCWALLRAELFVL